MIADAVRAAGDSIVALYVVVKPGQQKEGVALASDGSLVVRINAPAQEGKANERVVAFLAKLLGCAKGNISITRGEQSRHKELHIKNASVSDVVEALTTAL